jgi:Ca2+-transporting ATPase
MAAGMLVMFRWELDASGSLARAQTVALTTMVVFQVLQAGNARSEVESVFRRSPCSNPFLLVGTTGALLLHIAALYLPPTQYVLRIEPIELAAWGRILAMASTILIAMELHKALRGGQAARHKVRLPADGDTSGNTSRRTMREDADDALH